MSAAPADRRTALVTGASSGIGQATVRALRARGVEVIAVARRADRLESLVAETGATALVLDLNDTDALYAQLGPLAVDILVNSAGLGRGFDGLFRASRDDVARTIGTNVIAPIHVVRALVPGMIARRRGHVVHLGSVAGVYPTRSALYGASKGAIHLFSQTLRVELAGTGVRHTEIVPGRVRTEFFEAALDDAAARASVATDIQELEAADVAAAILFVLDAPRHVDVTMLEILPTEQTMGGAILRRTEPLP